MIIGGTPIPKRELIRIIINNFEDRIIREYYNIQPVTTLVDRLDSFNKKELLALIQKSSEGKDALEKAKATYPLTKNPTLYLVHVSRWPDLTKLKAKTDVLANNQKTDGLPFGENKTIRSVYMIASISKIEVLDRIYTKIPLVYEKTIEYRIADLASDDYDEVDEVISLEHAFILFSEDHNHALLACSDYVAVKPILSFGRYKFNITWQLPNLSEEMLFRLAQNADPRTAAFVNIKDDPQDEFDINSITVSDYQLGERHSFEHLRNNEARQQIYGFFVNHPGLSLGGVGITRRYGRIWTPAKLNNDQLLSLATTIIESTEEELDNEFSRDIRDYLDYFKNYPVNINNKILNPKCRNVFDQIIIAILQTKNSRTNEANLNVLVIENLIPESYRLDLNPVLTFNCSNCGEYIIRCPRCNMPLLPEKFEDEWLFTCTYCNFQKLYDGDTYKCDCGEEGEVTYSTDIWILPGAGFLKAANEFINNTLKIQQFKNSFIIIGQTLRLVKIKFKKSDNLEYSLEDFKKWNNRARIQYQKPSVNKVKNYYRILGRIKEKCKEKNYHPTIEDCQNCKISKMNNERIEKGEYMCLSRLFGFAIDEYFDGIHHGYEWADIQYEDIDVDSNIWKIGIHLKSRNPYTKKCIGRGKEQIKGLYAQYCYSIYQIAEGILDEEIIGVSIPNVICPDVIASFKYLALRFKIPLLILQEEDWIRILHRAFELIDLENQPIVPFKSV